MVVAEDKPPLAPTPANAAQRSSGHSRMTDAIPSGTWPPPGRVHLRKDFTLLFNDDFDRLISRLLIFCIDDRELGGDRGLLRLSATGWAVTETIPSYHANNNNGFARRASFCIKLQSRGN